VRFASRCGIACRKPDGPDRRVPTAVNEFADIGPVLHERVHRRLGTVDVALECQRKCLVQKGG
jgi:hypothetical protein